MALALGAASPIAAQQQQQHASGKTPTMAAMHCGARGMMMQKMHSDSMRGMMAMMGPPTPGMLLHHKQQLNLSAEQVNKLETLQKQAEAACSEHMRLGMEEHRAANQLLQAGSPDFAAYTARMKQAAAHMAEGHVAMAKAGVEARALLTPEQRESLSGMMEKMHKRP
jgi:Spy/CpxP family protein refolding chaperone